MKYLTGFLTSLAFLPLSQSAVSAAPAASETNPPAPYIVVPVAAAASSTKAKATVTPAPAKAKTIFKQAQPSYGKVKSKYISLANEAPFLLRFLNDTMPVFGLPGTNATGGITKRTQLLGDPTGLRTTLAENGIFLDIYTTSAFQRVKHGLRTSSAFVEADHGAINLDTGRMGLWPGGLFHVDVLSRYGSSASRQMAAGSSTITYTPYTYPVVGKKRIEISTYSFAQPINKHAAFLFGKISTIFLPDQTMFGSSPKVDWANFAFSGANTMLTDYYNGVTWAGIGVLSLNDNISLLGAVTDPYSETTNFAKHMYKHINIYIQSNISYNLKGLPGTITPSLNWTNKPKVDLSKPIDLEATVNNIVSNHSSGTGNNTANLEKDVVLRYRKHSHMFFTTLSQYLFLKDPANYKKDTFEGNLIRGLGIQGRFGVGPKRTNFLSATANIGIYGAGLLDARPADRFGVGYFYNTISKKFRNVYHDTTGRHLKNQNGMEVFYTANIVPSVDLSGSYQHIWHPTYASALNKSDKSDVFMLRMTVIW